MPKKKEVNYENNDFQKLESSKLTRFRKILKVESSLELSILMKILSVQNFKSSEITKLRKLKSFVHEHFENYLLTRF